MEEPNSKTEKLSHERIYFMGLGKCKYSSDIN